MPEERTRQASARDWLRDQGLDGLLAFSDGQNSFLQGNAVYVFSGARALGESAVFIPRDGATVLVASPAWDLERARSLSRTDETYAVDDLARGLKPILESAGALRMKLACVALSGQRRKLANEIESWFSTPPRAEDSLASTLARVRSQEELARSRKAVEIAEAGYRRLLAAAQPGMREFELAAEIYCDMKAIGAEDNFLLMSASQHNLAVRAAGRRVLEKGDIILAEITPCYAGQFAQICRTVVLGEVTPLLSDKYGLLQDAMRRGMEAAIPGATVAQATRAMNEVLTAAGYGDYCRPPYMRVRGHGLGITSDRPGDLHDESDVVFEEGMVFVLHPNQYIPEAGYLMCGETVVVSHNGAISLSERDSELDVIVV
jgi:Xaa-Pro dipeptidase